MTAPWDGPDAIGIDARAKAIWDASPSRAYSPAWEQLGDVTKSVWHERVMEELYGDLA